MHEEILSWNEMCGREARNLQAGMHFRSGGSYSVLLMSTRKNAPYPDAMAEDGTVLIYVGHDAPRKNGADTDLVDQPRHLPKGGLTQNGKFDEAAQAHKRGERPAERVRVYEKLRDGLWADNGWFLLVDSWLEAEGQRQVFKFKLLAIDDPPALDDDSYVPERRRMIPPAVKLEVWKRDGGRCVLCGSNVNLHFDHIIPWSKGGASDTAENVQLLCGRHNLQKSAKVE